MLDIPTIDAGDADEYDALQVEFTREQVAWLMQEARRRESSVSALLRAFLAASMRESENGGTAHDAKTEGVAGRDGAATGSEQDGDADESNLVDRLRSAHERLESLTDSTPPDRTDPEQEEFIGAGGVFRDGDEASNLRARARRFAEMADQTDDQDDEDSSNPLTTDAPDRSMFELIE